MIDHAKELQKSFEEYRRISTEPDWLHRPQTHRLIGVLEESLPDVLAKLDRLQAPCSWTPDYEEGGWLSGCGKRARRLWPNEEEEDPGDGHRYCHGCGRLIEVPK